MQRLEVSVAVRPIYASLGVKWLNKLEVTVLTGVVWIRIGTNFELCEHGNEIVGNSLTGPRKGNFSRKNANILESLDVQILVYLGCVSLD